MRAAARSAGWLLLGGALPLLALWYAISPVAFGDRQAADFHFNYFYAAEHLVAGESPYPTDGFVWRDGLVIDYVYPPLVALLTVPWTVLPIGLAESLFQLVLVGAFVATLAVLGVRDWRCYGLAFLWPPVTDAITTGNVSILLGLAAAIVWRYRDLPRAAGVALAVSIAAKVLLWPLALWLAATRRVGAAAWATGGAVVLLAGTWAAIGFQGLGEYPGLVRDLGELMDERGYTLYALGLDVGLGEESARAVWAAAAAALLAGIVVAARRGDERGAFVLALAAAIACAPIVWLHYFSLLLVAVAVVQPRLGALWFAGLPMHVLVSTGVYNGSTLQTASVLAIAAVVVAAAVARPLPRRRRGAGQPCGRSTTVSSSPRYSARAPGSARKSDVCERRVSSTSTMR